MITDDDSSTLDRDFIASVQSGNLHLHTQKRRWTDITIEVCRLCGHHSESLAHVLSHCRIHARLWHLRHNDIQNRLAAAIGATNAAVVVSVNKRVPGLDSPLRPDLVVDYGKGILLVDVTIPVEHASDRRRTLSVFEKARHVKHTKYQPLTHALQSRRGIPTRVEAFVIGALGTWDEKNADLFHRLGMPEYSELRDTLCRQTVAWARRIYEQHLALGQLKEEGGKTRYAPP